MKSLFIHPPLRSFSTPSSAIAELSGYIKSKGVNSSILDLNIDFYDNILTNENIENAKNICEGVLNNTTSNNYKDNICQQILYNYKPEIIKYILGRVDEAKEILRSNSFYDTAKYKIAYFIINNALLLLSLPYDTFIIHERSIIGNSSSLPLEKLCETTRNKEYNIFYKYFENKADEILSSNPDVISIIVDIEGQLIPALTLISILKTKGYNNIVLFGNYIALIQNEIKENKIFFEEYAPYVMYENHPLAMYEFFQYLEGNRKKEDVHNLLYVKENKVIENKYSSEEPTEFFVQDFDYTKTVKYFFPELVLPLLITQGCYWGKCKFCDLFSEKYTIKNIDYVIDEIKYYKENYGVKYFFLRDLSFSPSVAKEFSEKIIKSKLDICYTTFCRFEKEFDYKLLKQLHKSGLRCLNWGLESGSQKVLDDMQKGITLETVSRILKDCYKIGIGNKVSIMYALPNETFDDFMQTIDFVLKHKKYITSISDRLFFLKKYSSIFRNLGEYKIKLKGKNIRHEYSAVEIQEDIDLTKYNNELKKILDINSFIRGGYDEIMLYLDKNPHIFKKFYKMLITIRYKKEIKEFFK